MFAIALILRGSGCFTSPSQAGKARLSPHAPNHHVLQISTTIIETGFSKIPLYYNSFVFFCALISHAFLNTIYLLLNLALNFMMASRLFFNPNYEAKGERARPGRSFPRPRGKPASRKSSKGSWQGRAEAAGREGAASDARGGRAPQLRN